MKDTDRTKQQVVDELARLQRRISDLEALEAQLSHAEEALRRSEERHRFLYEMSPAISLVVGMDGRVRDVNRAALEAFGYSKDEIVGRPALDFVVPDERKRVAAALEKTLSGEYQPGMDLDIQTKDGARATLVTSPSVLVLEEDGKAVGMLVTAADMTQRKRAEEKLRQSERYFRSLIENTLEVIIVIAADGVIKYLSPAAQAVLGYKPEEVLGTDSLGFIHPDDIPYVTKKFGQMLQSPGGIATAEVRARHRDGSWRFMEAVGHNLLDDPVVAGIVVNYRDVTDRKEAGDALRESETRFRTLFEGAAIGMALVDMKGGVWDINPALESMLGYTQEELANMTQRLYLHPDDAMLDARQFTELVAGKRDRYQIDKRYVRKDGQVSWGRQSISLIRGPGGESLFTIAMVEDITERKRADERLKEGFARLRSMLDGVVETLASAVEMRDLYTAGHQRRVARLASAIAREMGLSNEQIEAIRMAGLVHDIGKMSVPGEILSKPAILTPVEFSLVKSHAQAGQDIMKGIEFPWPVGQIVAQHHERINGSGYPNGLRGEGITLEAKIVAVADVVEAMSSHRPYRPALGIEKALEEVSTNKGVLYDPNVVDACVRLFKEKGFEFE